MLASRLLLLASACGLALTAGPAIANEPKQTADVIREFGEPKPEILAAALKEKNELDGTKIGDKTLEEVLKALAKKHQITFVILDDEFKARKVESVKDKKSRIKSLDTKDMTVAEFLDVWLPSFGATYRIHEDYVAIVPLPAKVQEPNPTLKLRKDEPKPAPKPMEKPKPVGKKADPLEVLLEKLEQKYVVKEGVNVNDIPLWELLQDISKRYGINFVINEESFKQDGLPNIKQEKPNLAEGQPRNLTVGNFLTLALLSTNATYLIKNRSLEIVSLSYADVVTKSVAPPEPDGAVGISQPPVSVIFKETPLDEAVEKLQGMFSDSVILCPEAGDAKNRRVSARLQNVPMGTAAELLALQCDLHVVWRNGAYHITSKEHAKELFKKFLEEKRQVIEEQKRPKPPEKDPGAPGPKM